MKRQRFSREYKLEAVKQARDRGVASAVVARDLGIGANVVSRWVREAGGDIRKAFPGQGAARYRCMGIAAPRAPDPAKASEAGA